MEMFEVTIYQSIKAIHIASQFRSIKYLSKIKYVGILFASTSLGRTVCLSLHSLIFRRYKNNVWCLKAVAFLSYSSLTQSLLSFLGSCPTIYLNKCLILLNITTTVAKTIFWLWCLEKTTILLMVWKLLYCISLMLTFLWANSRISFQLSEFHSQEVYYQRGIRVFSYNFSSVSKNVTTNGTCFKFCEDCKLQWFCQELLCIK